MLYYHRRQFAQSVEWARYVWSRTFLEISQLAAVASPTTLLGTPGGDPTLQDSSFGKVLHVSIMVSLLVKMSLLSCHSLFFAPKIHQADNDGVF